MSAPTHDDLEALSEAAQRAANGGRHAEAALHFRALTDAARLRGMLDTAAQAATLAGSALRRDDRPAEALVAQEEAIALLRRGDPGATSRIQLAQAERAASLLDAGQAAASAEAYADLLAQGPIASLAAIALDGLIGARLLLGEVEAARLAFARLQAQAEGPGRLALAFREAALLRLSGELDAAEAAHEGLRAGLDGPRFVAPRAASLHDSGEIALLRQRFKAAVRSFEAAEEGFRAAGRPIGQHRAQLALLRVRLAQGKRAEVGRLGPMLAYAASRGLPLFEAELRLGEGNLLQAAGAPSLAAFDRGLHLAAQAGARFLAGRLHLSRWRASGEAIDRQRARDLLDGDLPWRAEVESERRRLW
jgi:hypothetical protein